MDHVIIGTAGHVDHGKTCLIKALTGIETDRLKEEKKRGITIELGFAYLDMPDGSRAGIVDVPGHEKFIKNMLAGAGGMDLAILVVAADEGVKPQTVEHLDILSVLGIKKGVIVLTKTDLVDTELLELAVEDVKDLVKGTFLENAPVIPVCALRQEGLDELKATLYRLCRELPERGESEDFRLPVDRVFTLKGFGTIVTGTLAEGRITRNQEAVLYPENIPVKIRSIQVHESDQQEACAGQRVAVNIPDYKKEDILRGDILASKDSMYPTHMLDVRLEVLKHTERRIKTGSRVHIYHGTKELQGKIILMDREDLCAGESCYAQLRLEEQTAVRKGDRFVLRFYSPVETIGGGVILDVCPEKHKRNDQKVLEAFRIKDKGTGKEQLELSVREHWGGFQQLEKLCKRYSLAYAEAKKAAKELEKEKRIFRISDERYLHKEELAYYQRKVDDFLGEFHKANPLEDGMGVEEARSRLSLPEPKYAEAILALLENEANIVIKNGRIRKKGFQVVMHKKENEMMEKILRDYLEAGYAFLTTDLYSREYPDQKRFQTVFYALLKKGSLICLNRQYCIPKELCERAKELFVKMSQENQVISTGEYRDCLGCSRKAAIALLEYFDKIEFTEKTEEGRCLRAKNEHR